MTTRDRLALIGISTIAVLGVVWLLLISPERKQASEISSQVAQANAQLASAETEATNARGAQTRYSAAYASVVNLGKAVPPSEEVPSLIYQLAQASNQKHVEFNSITTGGGPTSGPASTTSGAPVAAAAGFTQMPFTFVFDGSFSDLYRLFQQLNAATVRTASGGLQVSGRLLTLQSVKLEPKGTTTGHSSELTGTITASAYVLPAGSGLTGGSTATSPATAPATSASSGSSSSTRSISGAAAAAPAAVATAGVAR
jgi:Tfp pilus assembly protein PilO